MSEYKIGEYTFDSEDEYLAAQKEIKLIKLIKDKYDIEEPRIAAAILTKFKPQTVIGVKFVKKLEKTTASEVELTLKEIDKAVSATKDASNDVVKISTEEQASKPRKKIKTSTKVIWVCVFLFVSIGSIIYDMMDNTVTESTRVNGSTTASTDDEITNDKIKDDEQIINFNFSKVKLTEKQFVERYIDISTSLWGKDAIVLKVGSDNINWDRYEIYVNDKKDGRLTLTYDNDGYIKRASIGYENYSELMCVFIMTINNNMNFEDSKSFLVDLMKNHRIGDSDETEEIMYDGLYYKITELDLKTLDLVVGVEAFD